MTIFGRTIGIGCLIALACFGTLAALRFADGAWVWGLVFLAATALQGCAALHAAGRPVPADAPARRGAAAANLSSWRTLTTASALLAVALLFVNPAVIVALVTAYCVRTVITRRRWS